MAPSFEPEGISSDTAASQPPSVSPPRPTKATTIKHRMSNGHTPPKADPASNGYTSLNGDAVVDEVPHRRPPQTDPLDMDAKNQYVQDVIKKVNNITKIGVKHQFSLDKLPQVIVAGSQSAGKSSVLEAITEIPFPSRYGTCTTYPTRVTIEPSHEGVVIFEIEPSPDASTIKIEDLNSFKHTVKWTEWEVNKHAAMKNAIEKAEKLILSQSTSPSWSRHVLSITIRAPKKLPQQILDLPGMIENNPNDGSVPTMLESMVVKEMAKQNCLILAVISAGDDLANSKVLTLSRQFDETGQRTIGVFTKPDASIDSEVVEDRIKTVMGQGPHAVYRHRWHVLRNRSTDERKAKSSTLDRDQIEEDFFNDERTPWHRLDRKYKGVKSLRQCIQDMVYEMAKSVLPELRDQVEEQLRTTEADLRSRFSNTLSGNALGAAFQAAIERLKIAASNAVKGDNDYVIDQEFQPYSPAFLRARVHEENGILEWRLRNEGHTWHCTRWDEIDPDDDMTLINALFGEDMGVHSKSKDLSIEAHKTQLRERLKIRNEFKPERDTPAEECQRALDFLNLKPGMTLPGTFSPHQINSFVWQKARKWNKLSRQHVDEIYKHCVACFALIVTKSFESSGKRDQRGPDGFSNAQQIAERLMASMIEPQFKARCLDACIELERLENDRQDRAQNYVPQFMKKARGHEDKRRKARDISAVDTIRTRPEEKSMTPAQWSKATGGHDQLESSQQVAEEFLAKTQVQYEV
jgi:hypothetical protein